MTFGVGNVLATTVRVWAKNLPRFFLLTVICHLPIIGWNLLMAIDAIRDWVMEKVYYPMAKLHPALDPELASGAWITYAVLTAAIAMCTVGLLRDERVSIWRGLGETLRRLPWIVGVALIIRVVTYGTSLGITILRWKEERYFLRRSMFEYAITEALWVVLVSLVLVALPVAIVERRGVFATMRRTLALGKSERFKVLAVKVVHTVFLWAIYYGTSWLLIFRSDSSADYGRKFVIYAYVRFGIELVIGSLGAVLVAVVYERLRASKEGATPSQLQTVFD